MEVLLKTRFDGARFSGQRMVAAGAFVLGSSINPLTSNRFPQKTGMAASSLLLVVMSSRHQVCPFAGSSEVSDLSVQTISCRWPPELMTMGELLEACSSSAFHTSFPVCLSRASTV